MSNLRLIFLSSVLIMSVGLTPDVYAQSNHHHYDDSEEDEFEGPTGLGSGDAKFAQAIS